MKKFVIAMFTVALVTPMFAQAPAQTDQPKAEKASKKKAAKKKASKKKAEQPKAQ
jgi:hypothetical protein